MNIVITGASSGVGYQTALLLANLPNVRVLAIARREDKLKELQAAAPKGSIEMLCADISSGNLDLLQEKLREWARVDVLMNNAGALMNKPFMELEDSDWEEMYRANLLSAVRCCRLCLPFMGKESRGHIVNIGSMGGFQGSSKFPGLSAYSASKAALANFTECLAEELKEANIAVNCLAFGAVQTEMLDKAFPGYKAPVSASETAEYVAWFLQNGHKHQNAKIIALAQSVP